jgi:hypothetical protein
MKRRKPQLMQTTLTVEMTETEEKEQSARTIAKAVTLAITACDRHSQHAMDIITLTRAHFEHFGEKPKLQGLVATTWPIVLIAQPIGVRRIVTHYIIEPNGDVNLDRKYPRDHDETTRDSNVFTDTPPRL